MQLQRSPFRLAAVLIHLEDIATSSEWRGVPVQDELVIG